ncbi:MULTISPECIES: sugar ABC transporter ATP-binding protein [unclassified Mesorhizobium]|uniref:sugar ABC transporter ATP-binding protein n=1 Tax=unclassified Mesorhizobium TaxID=325217 RepID=UPI00241733C5|nr:MULTISPECIES: sugar ABC transporter ATP-binding protein [unclassified Mesorhizobium]WFP65604.1 sugar ABC transporter ATP-binding protein [Mesorhizobium sp. WSM4904]WFP78868.1 sugar ABC transporter ATP-binding protein [Mesorhizobium sp. WSM4906]
MTPIVDLKAATKDFRGNPAFLDVDFQLLPGEIHALLGENGAGKSTLTKVLAGVYPLSSGKLFIDGREERLSTPAEGLAKGIAMVYQENSLVPSMTVAQNIYLGKEKPLNRLRGVYISAQQFLQSLNFHVDPSAIVGSLGAAQKQMVEIARAVHHKAKVIIFDEPTATLTPEEKSYFFKLIRKLKEEGVSIIFISHALEEALLVADRITILRDGRLVASDKASAFDRQKIIQAMVGRTLTDEIYSGASRSRAPRRRGPKVLSVENLSMGNMVRNTSFSLYAGQVTGIFGLVGSGRTETLKVVSGVLKRDFFHGGEVKIGGQPKRYLVPAPAVRDGIVYVTEERKAEGFFETMSIAENIYMGHLGGQAYGGLNIISMKQARSLAEDWRKRLNIRAIDPNAKVIELSGGNQQKVVIAKALVQKPKLVIFDEPTRGVDVGAIAEIHAFINQLADQGIAIAVISSYLPEILTLSDRILIARQGKIVEEMDRRNATEEAIMYAAVH